MANLSSRISFDSGFQYSIGTKYFSFKDFKWRVLYHITFHKVNNFADIMEVEEVRTKINIRVNFEQDADVDTKMIFSFGATGLIEREFMLFERNRVSCTKVDKQRKLQFKSNGT